MPQILVNFGRTFALDVSSGADGTDACCSSQILPNTTALRARLLAELGNSVADAACDVCTDVCSSLNGGASDANRACTPARSTLVDDSNVDSAPRFIFTCNGRVIDGAFDPVICTDIRVIVAGAIKGGKGGFGANLRSAGRAGGVKANLDFSMCRDLSGRRLHDVNNELRLRKWLSGSEKDKRQRLGEDYEEARGDAGLQGWFLNVPNWAEGVKQARAGGADRKPRRKTALCRNWLDARENGRAAPAGAPRWWGCPRGAACEFAHGKEELRAEGKMAEAERSKEAARQERQGKLDAYTQGLYLYGGDGDGDDASGSNAGAASGGRSMAESVMQGLRASSSSSSSAAALASISVSAAAAGVGVKRPRPAPEPATSATAATNDSDDDEDAADDYLQLSFGKPVKGSKDTGVSAWAGVAPSSSSSSAAAAASRPSISQQGQTSRAVTAASLPTEWNQNDWLVPISATGSSGTSSAVSIEYLSQSTSSMVGAESSAAAGAQSDTLPHVHGTALAIAEVTGVGEFATVAVRGLRIPAPAHTPAASDSSASTNTSGTSSVTYYYEVELITCSGVVQVGWADSAFLSASSSAASSSSAGAGSAAADNIDVDDDGGDGVGDDGHSWSFDGGRGFKWHGGNAAASTAASDSSAAAGGDADGAATSLPPGCTRYGRLWQEGDVIGCWLTVTTTSGSGATTGGATAAGGASEVASIGYSINGEDQGPAFTFALLSAGAYSSTAPAASSSSTANTGSTSTSTSTNGNNYRLFPALSLDAGEVVRVNLGQAGFAYPCPSAATATAAYAARAEETAHGKQKAKARTAASAVSSNTVNLTSSTASTSAAGPRTDELQPASTSTAPASAAAAPSAAAVDLEARLSEDLEQCRAYGNPTSISAASLSASGVGIDQLRAALSGRGLKAGGTWSECAERLIAVLGARSEGDVPKKLRAAAAVVPSGSTGAGSAGFPGPKLAEQFAALSQVQQ